MVRPEFESTLLGLIETFRKGGEEMSDDECIADYLEEIADSLRDGKFDEEYA